MTMTDDDANRAATEAKAANIRPVKREDMPALKAVIDATGLFPSDMLDGMLASYFDEPSGDDGWLTYDDAGPKAIAYYAPERMTEGAWNLLLIAVHPDRQGQGIGSALLGHVEAALAARGARILLVETSGLESFARTRIFYRICGYGEEARIRNYYKAGEDKVVFLKALKA